MPDAVDREYLVNLYPALAGLPDERLGALLRPAVLDLPAGSQVFAEHQPCQGFPLLLAGSIKVVKQSTSGRELSCKKVLAIWKKACGLFRRRNPICRCCARR